MRLFVLCILILIGIMAWVTAPDNRWERIHGASLVNPPRPITSEKLAEVKKVNAEWVAVIPYGFSRSGSSGVTFDHSRQWWGEQTEGNCSLIQFAKENELKVMVKPHVWVMGEGWTGDFDLKSETQWQAWEQDYTAYIMNHARKSDSLGVEMFCIGTEYRIPAKERPLFWRNLIVKVKTVYDGKITYAANWDNYENVTWWDAVDYIGIDAYFPLVESDRPDIETIKRGWEPIKVRLAQFSSKWNKPILFTEYGFQSVDGGAGKHWEVDKSIAHANPELQADAYEATFQALEDESWYAGGFFWKWHFTMRTGDWYKTQWTPQNKPAEKVIARWYGKMD